MQLNIKDFISLLPQGFPTTEGLKPWQILQALPNLITNTLLHLGILHPDKPLYIHPSVRIHDSAVIAGPAIIGAGCFIGAHAVIRGGVWLGENVSIGAGVEVKQSVICAYTAIAHFNFIGDSLIGHRVNFEAGAIIANHFNERENKLITVMLDGQPVETGVTKFGALVGDDCKIGANAVLSPGTILAKGTVVNRLQLVDQGCQSNIQ